jgi:uncharacterized membrane protein
MTTSSSVRVSRRLGSPVHELFVLVSEAEHAVDVIEGLEQMTPIGELAAGVGARYRAALRVGPKTVQADIELEELIEDRLVRWRASNGDERSITFELRPVEDHTAVRITVTYERADGLSATLLAPVVEEAVRERARKTLDRLAALSSPGS